MANNNRFLALALLVWLAAAPAGEACAQWVQVNGIGGNIIEGSVFSTLGSNVVVGTTSGMIRSTDGGFTWAVVGPSVSVISVAICGNHFFAGTVGEGVLRSIDSGNNWMPVNSGLTNSSVTALATIGTNIFAGTSEAGVFLSTNDGESWSALVSLSPTSISCLAVMGTTLFVSSGSANVYETTDSGKSWQDIGSPTNDSPVRTLTVFGGQLFAGMIPEPQAVVSMNGRDGFEVARIWLLTASASVEQVCMLGVLKVSTNPMTAEQPGTRSIPG